MNVAASLVTTKDLWSFSRQFLTCFGREGFQDPEVLAGEFRKFFEIRGILRLQQLRELCQNTLGLARLTPYSPPGQERGTFVKLERLIQLFYKADDWEGSQEFTIVHELREIIGAVAKEVDPLFVDATGEDLEIQADAFAAALLTEKEGFLRDMEFSGLDPICLHTKYHKSYIGVVSRIATVLDSQNPKGHFWGAVFEDDPMAPKGYFKAKCFHRSPRYKPKVRYQVPNFLFPKRGQLVPLRGALLTALCHRQAVFIQRLTGLDFWDRYCLSVIIRPVDWWGRVAVLIVVAVPEQRADTVRPQIAAASPLIVEESFQQL